MQLSKSILYLLLGIFLINISAFAQNWNAEQKDVWKSVEAYWALDDSHDLEGFLNYFDDSYMGWSYDTEKPMSKTEVGEEIKNNYEKENKSSSKLMPLAIWVDGDMAFVHYKYTRTRKDESGMDETKNGRWTDILKKKGDKWVLVGDHGGNWDDDEDKD